MDRGVDLSEEEREDQFMLQAYRKLNGDGELLRDFAEFCCKRAALKKFGLAHTLSAVLTKMNSFGFVDQLERGGGRLSDQNAEVGTVLRGGRLLLAIDRKHAC